MTKHGEEQVPRMTQLTGETGCRFRRRLIDGFVEAHDVD